MNEKEMAGGCLCGAIRYRIVGAPKFVAQCYCKDCQKATGTGHTTIVGVMGSDLILEGTPAVYTCTGETGGKVSRHFCGTCGGRIFTSGDLPGPIKIVQAGSLDEPGRITPTDAIYVKDAIHWDTINPSLERFERLRPHSTSNTA